MMVSPRLLLAACTVALALPASASAGLFGHGHSSCAAPGYVDYGCAPTCAAPCGDVCGDVCGPTCAAPCGDVCAPVGCCESYGCPPQEGCLKRFGRKLWDLEQRKNAWILSKLHGLCHRDDCCDYGCVDYGCVDYGCEPTCAAPVYGDLCTPTCAAPCGDVCGDVCAPTCAAPCGDVCAPTCAAPVCGH
ncbi:hypothetical protein [Alienimonas sp. DA493]|uniref:hypothetical protein n=1 Tax=Alienimonas sp. DA493 TaxID=3373605 RepID=UPI00375439BA